MSKAIQCGLAYLVLTCSVHAQWSAAWPAKQYEGMPYEVVESNYHLSSQLWASVTERFGMPQPGSSADWPWQTQAYSGVEEVVSMGLTNYYAAYLTLTQRLDFAYPLTNPVSYTVGTNTFVAWFPANPPFGKMALWLADINSSFSDSFLNHRMVTNGTYDGYFANTNPIPRALPLWTFGQGYVYEYDTSGKALLARMATTVVTGYVSTNLLSYRLPTPPDDSKLSVATTNPVAWFESQYTSVVCTATISGWTNMAGSAPTGTAYSETLTFTNGQIRQLSDRLNWVTNIVFSGYTPSNGDCLTVAYTNGLTVYVDYNANLFYGTWTMKAGWLDGLQTNIGTLNWTGEGGGWKTVGNRNYYGQSTVSWNDAIANATVQTEGGAGGTTPPKEISFGLYEGSPPDERWEFFSQSQASVFVSSNAYGTNLERTAQLYLAITNSPMALINPQSSGYTATNTTYFKVWEGQSGLMSCVTSSVIGSSNMVVNYPPDPKTAGSSNYGWQVFGTLCNARWNFSYTNN